MTIRQANIGNIICRLVMLCRPFVLNGLHLKMAPDIGFDFSIIVFGVAVTRLPGFMMAARYQEHINLLTMNRVRTANMAIRVGVPEMPVGIAPVLERGRHHIAAVRSRQHLHGMDPFGSMGCHDHGAGGDGMFSGVSHTLTMFFLSLDNWAFFKKLPARLRERLCQAVAIDFGIKPSLIGEESDLFNFGGE